MKSMAVIGGGLVVSQGPFGYTLVISAHFIYSNRVDGDALGTDLVDEMREETFAYLQECKSKYGKNLAVVCGFDANVALPAGVPGVTGHSLLAPLRSHKVAMQQRVVGWMQDMCVRAVTTFAIYTH